jgi:hypothetical protein
MVMVCLGEKKHTHTSTLAMPPEAAPFVFNMLTGLFEEEILVRNYMEDHFQQVSALPPFFELSKEVSFLFTKQDCCVFNSQHSLSSQFVDSRT